MIDRLLQPAIASTKKSILLLGPRQTGKSTLLSASKPALSINLANERVFLEHSANAAALEEIVGERNPATVFVDEIQRLPSMLNTIQALIDERTRARKPIRFLLTGSSARKLRRGKANLLPGRVLVFELGPLVAAELKYAVNTKRALSLGMLPEPYLEPSVHAARQLLSSYAASYLKEEIQAEALTQNLEGFSRFLFIAAECSGQLLDFSKIATKAKVARTSTTRFFDILEDTLIAHRVPPFSAAKDADLVKHPRYFFFDTGVLNGLRGDFEIPPERAGFLFEHLLFNQIRSSAAAREIPCRIFGFRTRGGLEIDFIVELGRQTWAIEAKSGTFDPRQSDSVFAQAKRYLPGEARCIIAHTGSERRKLATCRMLPWQVLLQEMGL